MADEIKPKVEEKKVEEVKPEVKSEVKKEATKVVKKDEAIALGKNLHASMKQCKYICKVIKKKSIDEAINYLEDVAKKKKLIPFKGEIPHRGKGIMSGRYPVNASKLIINVLKGLKGNVLANQMDLDKTKIYYASASWASRPSKKGGGRFKRTNVILKAKEVMK
jgi:ribosomal protein L22